MTPEYLRRDSIGSRQSGLQCFVHRRFVRRQELEPVIVGRHRERYRPEPRNPLREQRSQSLVNEPAFERKEKKVVPFARFHSLDEKLVGSAECATTFAAPRGLARALPSPGPRNNPRAASPSRERSADASSPESGRRLPSHRGIAPLTFGARRTHAIMSRTRTNSSGVPAKRIDRREKSRDERFFDCAEPRAAQILDADVRVADDRADRHAMSSCNRRGLRHAIRRHHRVRPWNIPGIPSSAVPPLLTKSQYPLPFVIGQISESLSAPNFVQQLARARILRLRRRSLHAEREHRAGASTGYRDSITPASIPSRAAATSMSSSVCRRHACHSAESPGPVSAAARALKQSRDSLRASDLQHAIDRREVDAEVEDSMSRRRTAASPCEALPRPILFAFGRAIHDAARWCPPTPAARRESPDTRSPSASGCW